MIAHFFDMSRSEKSRAKFVSFDPRFLAIWGGNQVRHMVSETKAKHFRNSILQSQINLCNLPNVEKNAQNFAIIRATKISKSRKWFYKLHLSTFFFFIFTVLKKFFYCFTNQISGIKIFLN